MPFLVQLRDVLIESTGTGEAGCVECKLPERKLSDSKESPIILETKWKLSVQALDYKQVDPKRDLEESALDNTL